MPASMVVLGPEASSEYFNIDGSIQSTNTSMYLNIGDDSTSYKTLTFEESSSTTAWGLEGDTIITTQSSSYGRRGFCPFSLPIWASYMNKTTDFPFLCRRTQLPSVPSGRWILAGLFPDRKRYPKRQDLQQLPVAPSSLPLLGSYEEWTG